MSQVAGTTAFRSIHRWKRSAVLAVLSGILLGACDESFTVAPRAGTQTRPDSMPDLRVVLSNAATRAAGGISTSRGGSAADAESESVAWLSSAPNAYPGALAIIIRNATTKGADLGVPVVDGGFDPVRIVASTGDQLSITITTPTGSVAASRAVPARRPPVIVRSTPPKGRIDVALLVRPTVIFSEPLDKSTVQPGVVALMLDGQPVAGHTETAANGLTVTFVPDVPLSPGTTYVLAVGEGIRDMDGDAAAPSPAATVFTTELGPMPFADVAYTGFDGKNSQVFITQTGGTVKQLTFDGANLKPAWSPDGQRIAFVHVDANGVKGPGGFPFAYIYIMNADGTNVVARTTSPTLWAAAWSPDGKRLAVSDEGIYEAEIYILNADDDEPPVHIATDARSPAWSPDGTRIAFVRTSGDDGYHSIWLMNPDGSGQQQLTEIDPGAIFAHPSWSPDGKELVYSKCHQGECRIYRMAASGGLPGMISTGGRPEEADWSPDGKFIATSTWVYPVGNSSLAYMPATGGNIIFTTTKGYNPAWRPTPPAAPVAEASSVQARARGRR